MLLRSVVLITGKSGLLQSITFHKNAATHWGGNSLFLLNPVHETSPFSQFLTLPIINECLSAHSVPTDRAKEEELCFIIGSC